MNPLNVSKRKLVVYLIIGPTSKIYVGKTKSAYHRCYQYRRAFRNNLTHQINAHLMHAMRKYGYDSFRMIDWEYCTDDDHLTERELFWMDFFNTTNRSVGYNLRRDSRNGMLVHNETRSKITANLTSQWANGVRNDHGRKLAANWSTTPERRPIQADIMRKTLTKYKYVINDVLTVHYRFLPVLGFKHAPGEFKRRKSDRVTIKGLTVERVRLNG